MSQEDSAFARTFSTMVIALTVFGVAMIFLARYIEGRSLPVRETADAAERIAPVGQVNTEPVEQPPAEPAAEVAAAEDPGKRVYDSTCSACHATPAVGAPVFGNTEDWAPRIDKGLEALYDSALNGFQGEKGVMLPKGGRPDLADEDVKAAVRYMVANSGGADLVEQAAPPEEAAAADTPAAEATAAEEQPLALGKQTYDAACFICHTPGAAGAPKLGDSEAWAPRIEQGKEVLYDHALKGFMGKAGLMPPKGGRVDLSDEQVKAAVSYMVDSAQ